MNKMMRTILSFCVSVFLCSWLGAFAATKTVTWSLPADWEGNVELDQICEPVGAPSVAYYNALIEVPASATNFVITASDVAYRASELARPAPVLEPSVIGEPQNAPVEDAALYAGVYPSDVFEQGEPWEMNGKTVLPVRIKVYRWNGPANKVEALESLKLSIACESPRATLKLTTSGVGDVSAKYIVISPHNFVEYWQEFIDYRKSTHPDMTFALVDADDIYSEYQGKDEALKIHHFIEAMKAKGTEYVLLGAGQKKNDYAFDKNTMIPSRIVCIRGENTQICDYWYCVTDKKGGQEVWDYNGDGIYLASKNSSGGYTADATGKFSWVSTVKVFRFPARSSVTLGGKTKTAQQQIHGYVEKLRRFEQGLFAGRFSQAIIADTLGDQYDKSQGNTDASMTMEREFYDLGANIFSEVHGKSISQNEYETRERGYSYFTLKRPVGYNRSVLQHYYSNGENESMFLGRNFDAMLINSHGSPDLVEPIDRGEVFKATGLCGFYIMCVPCHAGNPGAGANNIVAISEASVLNPDGGSLVCFANSGFGWWGGKDTYSQKIERDVVRSLYGYSGSFQNAGAARMNAQNSYGTPSPGNSNGQVIANSMAYGDPLVALSPIWSRTVQSDGNWYRNDQMSTPSQQEFATGLTINATAGDQTITITNAIGCANLTINGTSGKTLTLAASGSGKFKVSNSVTVNNGMTLNWDVPGGFGRNGINLAAGGNLRLRAEGYYGIEFQGMNSLTVAPPANKTAIVDFDSKGYFRDTKTGPISVNGPGETIFRSRQAGIFSTGFTVAVNGGTLTLETPCVGGSGSQSSTTPLFNVKNATLAVRPNPNWTPECFSRRVSFENGALNSRYDKFYLGANVSGYPGLDVTVDGPNNVFQGSSPIRLNGQLRIHSTTGGVVNVTGEMVNGNGTGSLKLDNKVTAKLAAVNTFSGGITVPSGARLVVDNVRGLGTGSVVVQSGGVLQMNAMPLAGVKSVTLQSGAKLVLKSTGSGSYQMYSPSQTSFTLADGVKVYDSNDETKELDGIVTPEGAYFISDAAKYWGNVSGGKWKNDSSVLAWKKKNVADNLAYADGDTVLFKNITGTSSTTVPVEGNVSPGMMAFQNTDTAYNFTGSGTITVGSMATAGTTSFAPAIKATSQVSIGGKTTLGNVTTPIINVAGGGALQVTGTANGIDTIRVIQMKITSTIGFQNATPREHAPEMSELRFYNKSGTQIIFPSGTVIKDSVGNSCTVSGGNTTSGHTFSQTSGSLYKLFDQNCGTYHMIGSNITGPWTITITCSQPIEVFGSFAYGRGQKRTSSNPIYAAVVGSYPDANPMQWTMSTGDAEASLKQVYSKNMGQDTAASSLTSQFGITWPSTSKATVQNGGTLYLSGTYNVPVTVNAGATLAVTNTSKATFSGGKTWPTGTYSMTVDTKDAKKQTAWFQVTQNAGFSSAWQFQSDDDTAIELRSGDLWVATAGVKAPPYSRTLSANGNWNTTDWVDGKTNQFDVAWGSATTKPTGSATLTVTGTNLTMSVDCGVNLDTLKVVTPTNCFPGTFTATGSSALGISALDFRDFNGKVIWNPPLASWGTHVYVGTNDVTIASMTSGKGNLQVGAGGRATVPEKFAAYDVDNDSYVRFTGTHSFAMGDIPTKGYLSFKNTTLSGSFQNSLIKYVVEKDDALTFTGDANNYNARMSSSFDIRGGNVTINSNGASTWFGINGETSFRQTNGTFRCTANDTSMSASNSGFLVGYSASSSDNFEFDISGGRFEIPNTYINFFGPVRFNLTSNGVVQAKGVYRGSNKGIITVNEGAAFELGTIGLVAGACDFNLYGGTLAGFENGAHTRSTVNLVGVGTLAAKANTTFTIDAGTINADGATLNVGNANYTGTVKLEDIPSGITNITVTAGTWDMGEFRPTNTVPVSVLTGKIAAQLTDDELRQAAEDGGFKLIKTSLPDGAEIEDRVAVVTRGGVAVEAMGSVRNGYIYIGVDYVYPLYGTVEVEKVGGGGQRNYLFSDIAWHDSIGMPFNGEWSAVQSAVLSNELADVTLTITNAFTSSLKVVNSGELYINSEQIYTSLATLDNSASTGKTTIGFGISTTLNPGTFTRLMNRGTCVISIPSGKTVAFGAGVDPGTYTAAAGATVRFEGERVQTEYNPTAGVYNNYENAFISVPQASGRDNDAWFKCTDGDYLRAMGEYTDAINALGWNVQVDGGEFHFATNHAGQATWYGRNLRTFNQTGGKTVVETRDTSYGFFINYAGATPAGVVTFNISGGLFDCSETRFKFGKAGAATVNISGGEMRVLGILKNNTDSSVGGTINLNGGKLSVGTSGIAANIATLNFNGGTYNAVADTALNNAFTLGANTTSYLTATNNATFTVGVIPGGSGTLLCNPSDGSKIVLPGGSYGNAKLGGKFTYKLTAAQQSAVTSQQLFTLAAGDDGSRVSVVNSDGTTPASGAYFVRDGKFEWVPTAAYAMPVRAAVSNDVAWTAIDWYDSSATPKKVSGEYLTASGASATFELTVVSNAVLSGTATAGTLVVSGEGALTIPSTLTVNTMKGSGTVVADACIPTWGGLTANAWTGTVKLTGALPEDCNLGNLGNADSTIEFAGTLSATAGKRYLAVNSTVNSRFILSGNLSCDNGNSSSVQAVFNGPFEGTGTLAMTDHGTMTSADIYKILGDMSNFRGTISVGDTMRSITIGAHNAGNGYLYITENKGATIAAGKQWSAASGCAINVDAGGVLNIEPRSGDAAATSTVSVQSGGYINLLQTDSSQIEWRVSSTALNMNGGGVMINGVAISSERYTVANGTITLKSSATGASMSLNIIGGAKDRPGLSIADGNYAGMVPVKGSAWNQAAQHTTTASFTEYANNLKEVLPNGTVYSGPMKATMSGNNTYTAGVTANNGHAQMMYGYIDDGGNGAKIIVENIPYTQYDVYVYPGGDITSTSSSFRPVTVTVGNKTAVCPAKDTNWGNANSTHGTVTLVRGASGNFVKVEECTGSTLTVQGGTKSGNARGGIAAIQIFNTGTRLNTLTWNGGSTGGTWNRTSANWTSSASASTTWNEVADGVNTAAFNGDTSLTLGATVSPDVIDIRSNNTSQTRAGYVPASSALLFSGVKLSDITTFSGDLGGGWVADAPASVFHKKVTGDTVTMQFQLNDAGYIKCAKLSLTQQGDDVYGYVMWAKNIQNATLGVDFDNPPVTPGTASIATTDDANGYGIKNLKYVIHSVGNLVVGGAEKFGKAFTVTNGILTVATDALTQDVTLASGGKLNIISTEITNEYVVTSGKVVNGGYANILVNGEAIDQDSWNLEELTSGKLKRITKPGTTPFTYTIASSSPSPLAWTNQPWVASNFFYVLPEEWTTGTVSEVKLTVDGGVTNTLVANANMAITLFKIANSGCVMVTNGLVDGHAGRVTLPGGPFNLTVGTVDDSASSGTTVLGFAPTNVTAGANTVISNAIAGALTVGAGSKATINGTAHSYAVSSGGEVRFEDGAVTTKRVDADGAIVSYRDAAFDVGTTEYWKLKVLAGDFVTLNSEAFVNPIEVRGGELVLTNKNSQTKIWYGGKNETTKAHSTMSITGGKVTVLSSGVGTETSNCGFLFGQTTHGPDPVLTVDGGEFDISGGRFTFWQHSVVNLVNGGILKAKGVNKQAGDQSYLNINQGGILELGELGVTKANNQTLTVTMNGGTLRASDDAEEKLPIALTATNTFSAAANKTLTVSGALSGAGAVVIGEEGYAGTVVLSNATALTTTIAIDYGTLAMPTNTIAANLVIGPHGKLDLRGLPGTSAPTEFAVTTGTITLEDGATLAGNVTVNGQALKASDKWEIEGGKIKRRIITPPFKFIITQNGNWNEQTWYDAHDIVLRDYEVAEEAAKKPSITLEVQNESSLFITNELDLTSLAATGQRVTLDFTGYNGEELASKATFLHPATNVFIRTTSAISGNCEKAEPNLPAGYTGAFIDDATGLRYVITAPRKGYDYVGTINDENKSFSAIAWEGGVTYTNDYQNTVTLKVDGFFTLTLDQNLELYTFALAKFGENPSAYVTLASTGDFAATIARVARFDLGGVDTVETPVDFGDRIVQMPVGYLSLLSDYSGPLKNGYVFCGENNAITGGAFAGERVSLAGGGTLSGEFAITEGGKVYLGGSYSGSDATFDVGDGELYVSYGTSTLDAVGGNDPEGALTIYGGMLTANVNGFKGTVALGGDEDWQTGALRLSGVAAGPVNVSSNGTLYVTRTTVGQTAFEVTTGTLTFDKDHGAKLYVDDELIATSRITVSGGTIQVQDVIPSTPFTFTISQSGTYEWSKLAWMGANGVPVTPEYWEQPVASARLTAANGITATVNVDTNLNIGAFTMAGNTTVAMATAGSHLGTVAGSGTIACDFWPEGNNVGTLGEDWTGTFRVSANSAEKNNWDMTSYYNETNSTFAYAGTVSKGYFNKTNMVEYGAINLTGSITFHDGYSHMGVASSPCNYIYTKLSGNGSWSCTKAVTPIVWFKDVGEFTGALSTVANGYRFVVGDGEMTADADYPVKGGLTVVGDTTLTVGATINAPGGVLVTNATLTVAYAGNLKDAGPMTIGGAGKVVVHDGVLSNAVTIATGGTLDLQIAYLESANAFQITTGTLTNNGGTILVNNGPIPEGWHVVGNRLVKYATLFWIAQSGNWNDPNVWAHQDGSPAIFQDGDIVNFTNGVASVTLTANVAPYAIVVAEGANVTLNGNHSLGTPAITGAGTLVVNPGLGLELENFIPADCFAGFTGTYQIKSGRIKYTAAIAQAVTLKVTDGGQLWLAGGTWNNPFELSGQGRKSGANDVEYAALRLEGNQLGTGSSIEFVEEDGFITPGIGSTNGYTVPSVLSGCGMMVRGSGEMYLSVPKTQAAQIEGPVIINGCTVKFGDTWENDWDTQYKLGTSVEVKSGATLRLHLCQHGGTGVDDVDKSHFVTPVILSGGRLYDRDGSYCYDSVEVRSDSTFTAGDWGKRHIIKSLSGTGRLTVTSHNDSVLGILGGTFTGSIYNNGNGKVTPRNDALANATLELTSGGQLSLLDATQTIGKLMGGGKAYADQAATLTLKGGAYAGVIQNTSGGVGSTTLGLTIDGDVVLSGANTYTGLTTINEGAVLSCVAASGATVSFPGGIEGTGMLVAEGAGTLDLAGYRLNDGAGLMLANAGTIAFTLTTAETNGTAWVSFARMVDDNIGNVALHNPDGSLNETFLIPQSINGVLMSKVKSDMPTPKYGYAFDGNLNAETGCTALSFGGESGDSYETSGHGQAYKFASGYTPYGGNFAKPTGGGWTIATFAKPVATENRVFWTLGDANDLFGLAVAPNRSVKVFKAANNTAHTTLLTSAPIEDFSLEYHLFVMTYDGTTLMLYVDGVAQGEGYAGTVSFPNNQKFQFGSIHGGAGNTGVSRGDDILLDEWRVYSEVLTAEQLVTLANEFKPWRANAVEKGSILFIASSDDWDPAQLPTTAGKATASENISFANNAAYLRQLVDGSDTVALVTDATAGTYIYGLHAINGGTGLGAITRNVYLAMNAGTAYLVSGGEDAAYNTDTKTIPTGNLLTQLGGSAIVDYVFGAGHKGGWNGITAEVKGDTGVTITDDAQVRGTVAGGWSSIHQAQPKVSGNTSVLVRNIQRLNTVSSSLYSNADNYLIGGSVFIGNGGGGVITGNTMVTVDIDDTQSGTFVKNIVGGSYYGGGHDMTIGGSSSVTVSAPKTVSFTGTFHAGGYGDAAHSTVAGTAAMTLRNANFNAATLKGGNATGAKSLAASFDEDATFTPKAIDGFDTVKVSAKKSATVTLGKVFANQALTLEGGHFELKDAAPIALSSLTLADSPTLTIAPNKTDAAIQVTNGSVDLNGATLALDPLYFRDIPEDDTSTYVLMSAPTIVTNGVQLGKGMWTLALEGTAGSGQTLKVTHGKGFYFIIAQDEWTEEKYVEHDDENTKQSLSVDTKWLVEKTELTEETVKDVDLVMDTLNDDGANGAKVFESYVLGLDPNDEASKPVPAPVQTEDPTTVTFKLDNVAVNPRSGAKNVTYNVWTGSAPGQEKEPAAQNIHYTDPVSVGLPASGVKYYHIEVMID